MRTWVASCLAIALAACASENSQKQATSSPPTASRPRGPAFEVVRIDDEPDPLQVIEESSLPPKSGMAIMSETTLISGNKVVQRRFMRIVVNASETPEGACDRFLQWVQTAHIDLPKDRRFACQSIPVYDRKLHTVTIDAVRSVVLTGAPIISQRDVVDAYVGDDKSDDDDDLLDVAVKLSPEGRSKLKAATGDWIHRRLGVLADGMVSIAPLVKGEIDTDTLTIAFGPRSPAELDKAQAFVSRILGK